MKGMGDKRGHSRKTVMIFKHDFSECSHQGPSDKQTREVKD